MTLRILHTSCGRPWRGRGPTSSSTPWVEIGAKRNGLTTKVTVIEGDRLGQQVGGCLEGSEPFSELFFRSLILRPPPKLEGTLAGDVIPDYGHPRPPHTVPLFFKLEYPFDF